MSILLGPYDKEHEPNKSEEDEDLLVFGYACKLFRDDTKALLESSGQLLIPWMGDNSLMVDRYDVRNRLDDKSQFGVKSNLPYKMSREEREMEEQLDKERYLALHWDDIRVEEQEEEEKRRALEGYNSIGFSYKEMKLPVQPAPSEVASPQIQEHPPSSSLDVEEGDEFVVPDGLVVPEGMKMPASGKLHSIIQKTALFICQQGTQMEIIIKAKQNSNPFFSFLNMSDPLFPYYTHLKSILANGTYIPKKETTIEQDNPQIETAVNVEENQSDAITEGLPSQDDEIESDVRLINTETNNREDSDSESDSDNEYLHPLLMISRSKSSTPTPPVPSTKEATPTPEGGALTSVATVNFRAKSLGVNAAPSISVRKSSDFDKETIVSSTSSAHAHQHQYASYPYPGVGQAIHPHYSDPSSNGGSYPPHHQPPHMYETHYPPHPHTPHYPHPPHPGGSHPGHYDHHNYEAYYAAMSAFHTGSNIPNGFVQAIPTPPPPDLQPIIDKTAEYVAKNGNSFEATIIKRHAGDSRFNFLNPWDEFHPYYCYQKQNRTVHISSTEGTSNYTETSLISEKPNVQKLSSSGAVSFKLQTKTAKLLLPHEDDRFEETLEDGGNNEEEEPQAKKQRLEENGEQGPDQIGSSVQAFLSTVKEMMFVKDDV